MKIQLLKSVKDGTGWHKPGIILETDEETAADLLKKKAAVVLPSEEQSKEKASVNSNAPSKGEDASDSLTEDEIEEISQLLCSIEGVNPSIAEELMAAGYQSLDAVAKADKAVLAKVPGIGAPLAKKIRKSAEVLLKN